MLWTSIISVGKQSPNFAHNKSFSLHPNKCKTVSKLVMYYCKSTYKTLAQKLSFYTKENRNCHVYSSCHNGLFCILLIVENGEHACLLFWSQQKAGSKKMASKKGKLWMLSYECEISCNLHDLVFWVISFRCTLHTIKSTNFKCTIYSSKNINVIIV